MNDRSRREEEFPSLGGGPAAVTPADLWGQKSFRDRLTGDSSHLISSRTQSAILSGTSLSCTTLTQHAKACKEAPFGAKLRQTTCKCGSIQMIMLTTSPIEKLWPGVYSNQGTFWPTCARDDSVCIYDAFDSKHSL